MNMSKLPINLVIISSTKGHYGNKNCYQLTIERLKRLLGEKMEIFSNKYIHIKESPDEHNISLEMQNYALLNDIQPIISVGEWAHFNISHYLEHSKDIYTIFSQQKLHNNEFTFWIEDDEFLVPKIENLTFFIEKSIDLLKSDKNILTCRFLREKQHLIDSNPIKLNDLFWLQGEFFAFQPNISRTRDLHIASQIMRKFYDGKIQIEVYFSNIIKQLSESPRPFAVIDFDCAETLHFGSQTPEKDINDFLVKNSIYS